MAGEESIGGISASVGVDTSGVAPSLAALRSSLDQVERELQELHGAFGQTGAAAALTGEKIGQLAARKLELRSQIGQATAALQQQATITSAVSVGMNGLSAGSGNAAMRMMLVAQTADDLQYGFKSIVNNIPSLLMSFGMGAGLAGGLSIVAVGVNQLINNWGALEAALGTGFTAPALTGLEAMSEKLKGVKKEIDGLRESGKLSLPEMGRFKKLQEEEKLLEKQIADQKQFDTLMEGRSKAEKERASGFSEAVAESGPGMALGQLELYLEQQANEKGQVGVLGAEVGTAGQVAQRLFTAASRGDETALKSIMKALPESNEFRRKIVESSPETKRKNKEEEAALEAEQKRNVAAYDASVKAQEDRIKAEAKAFKQGHEGNILGKIERGEQLTPDELKSAPDSLRDKYLREKIERGDPLSLKEREIAPKKFGEEEDERTLKLADKRMALEEKGLGLQWDLFKLKNPERVGQTLSGDAYTSSHRATPMMEQVKELQAIKEMNAKIEENTRHLRDFKPLTIRRVPR